MKFLFHRGVKVQNQNGLMDIPSDIDKLKLLHTSATVDYRNLPCHVGNFDVISARETSKINDSRCVKMLESLLQSGMSG